VAVLRIALSLIVVLCFAAPAAAQFATSDLNGVWNIQGAETVADPEQNGGFVLGNIVFNVQGGVVGGSLVDSRGITEFLFDEGSITVNADGTLSGTVGDDEGMVQVLGRMLPGKQVIVAVTTGNAGSQNPSYTIVVLVRNVSLDAPQFSQADVTGSWRSASLLVPQLPAFLPDTLDGTITFDDEGGIASGTLRSSNGSVSTNITGNLFVVSNGFFSGALSIDLDTTVDVSSFVGYMSPDKSLLAGITVRDRPGPGLVQNGILVLQRRPAPSVLFANVDAVGRWDLFSLHGLNNQGNEGQWLVGNIVVGAGGLITSGTLTGPGGLTTSGTLTGPGGEEDVVVNLDDDTSNRLAIDSTGALTGNIVTELRILDLRGTMNAAKDRIVGVDALQEEARQVGFFTLLKADAVPPPPMSTVQFRATSVAPRVAEGGTAALVVERSGATTTTVTVQYSVTGGTATLGSDFNVVSGTLTSATGTLTFERGELTKTINVVALPDTTIESDETVNLALTNPTGGAELGSRATSVVTIGDGAAVQFQQPVYTVKENVPSVVITAVRTGAATTPFTVTYTATPLTPGREGDFKIPLPSVLTFAAGVLTRTISVTIVNNTLVDGNRSVLLSLGQPTNGAQLGSQATATLTIQDDDLPGTFKVDKTAYTVLESAGSLSIIVRRTGTSLAGNVTVDYATQDGTAISNGTPPDYSPQSGTLTFKAGETMKTVSIPVFRDNIVDGPKTFTFSLSNPGSGATLVEGQSSAQVTITDVDVAGLIKFVPDKYSVSEGGGKVTLTVQRSGGTAGGVLVDFQTLNGTAVGGSEGQGDFETRSGTLTFGFGNTSATITIFINQDTLAEGNETFTVELLNPRGGATLPVPPALGRVATVTIVDDESAFQFSAPALSVKEGTPSAVITVLRTGTLTAPATVTFSATLDTAQPGTDFTPVSGTLTFAANVPSKTFNVPIVNNTRLDGARRVRLALGNPTGGAQLGTVSTAILSIDDNEQAGTFRLDKDAYTVLESAGFVTVNVLRSGLNLTGNVSINLVATDGTAKSGINYGAPPTTLIFAAGEITKPVKVPILRDFVVTGPQKFTLALSEPSSGATLDAPATATVTVTEADVAGLVKFSSATYVVSESAGTATLTVVRTGGIAAGVLVEFTTVDGTAVGGSEGDFAPTRGILTFGAGNTSATITVPITSDNIAEGSESFQVRLLNPTGGATLGSPATATVTIMDDDSSMVQFSGNFIGNFPEIVRIGSLVGEVLVDFQSIDGTAIGNVDYAPTAGTLTFKANTRATTIPLVIFNDTIAEGPETFTYALHNPRGARLGPDSQKTFTITDNDFGGSDVQFSAPSYSGAEGQTVTLTVVRTGGIGSSLVVQWAAGEGTASPGVDFTPASGSVTFGVNAQSATFTITLLADGFVEGTETVPITLSIPKAAATLGAQSTTTLQIQDVAPPAAVVQFTSASFSSILGQDKQITLARTGALGSPLSVNVTVTGGTAVAGEDFSLGEVANRTVVNFGPTDTTASFPSTPASPGATTPTSRRSSASASPPARAPSAPSAPRP